MIKIFKKKLVYLVLMLLVLTSFSAGSVSAYTYNPAEYRTGVANLNNTPENSAKYGDRLILPEIGWKRVDGDSGEIGLPSSFKRYTDGGFYKASYSQSQYATDPFLFYFKGTKLRIISKIGNDMGIAKISIDGIERGEFTGYSEGNSISAAMIYEIKNLSNTVHSVEITPSNPSKALLIDAIDVEDTGQLFPPVASESINLNTNLIEVFEGSQDKLTATVLPVNAKNKKVVWSSSNPAFATVDQNGNVSGLKAGNVIITAKIEGTTLSATAYVKVKAPELTSITLDRYSLELIEGSQDKLTATVLPENVSNKKVVWTSSDESIATVDQEGNVSAIKVGEAIITAKIEGTELVATCKVTVKAPEQENANAILSITMISSITKEYDVSSKVVNDYLRWFETATGTSTFKFTKTLSPYKKVTEYIVHDKIASFEVREY